MKASSIVTRSSQSISLRYRRNVGCDQDVELTSMDLRTENHQRNAESSTTFNPTYVGQTPVTTVWQLRASSESIEDLLSDFLKTY